MPKKVTFKKLVIFTITALVIVIIMLAFFANNLNTKLKKVELVGGKGNASIINQRIAFKFNSPVSKTASKIEALVYKQGEIIEAEVKEFVIGESIYVLLESNLDYDSDYRVEVKGVKDVYQKDINEVYVDFKTIKAGFYYLEFGEESEDKLDKIIKYDLADKKAQTIYRINNIQNFAFNNQYMAIIAEENEYTRLIVLDLDTNKEIKNTKFDFKQIGKVAVTQKNNRILFTLQEYEFEGEFVIPTTGYEVFYYDIDTEELEKFEYGNIQFDVSEIVIAPGGDFVLVEDSTEGFYLIDLNNPEAGISLGRFISTGGFSSDAKKILFLTFEPENMDKNIFITYNDIDKGLLNLTNGEYEVIDPKFFNNSDQVVYAREKAKSDSRGIYRVVTSDLKGIETPILDEEGFSLEYPSLSYNDKYAVVEKYSIESLQDYNYSRSNGYLTKPDKAELVVIEMESKEIVVDNLQGIEAKWVW